MSIFSKPIPDEMRSLRSYQIIQSKKILRSDPLNTDGAHQRAMIILLLNEILDELRKPTPINDDHLLEDKVATAACAWPL